MQAYQAGVSALRLSLKDVTVERAENLVDQIQEVRIICLKTSTVCISLFSSNLTLKHLILFTSFVTPRMR